MILTKKELEWAVYPGRIIVRERVVRLKEAGLLLNVRVVDELAKGKEHVVLFHSIDREQHVIGWSFVDHPEGRASRRASRTGMNGRNMLIAARSFYKKYGIIPQEYESTYTIEEQEGPRGTIYYFRLKRRETSTALLMCS